MTESEGGQVPAIAIRALKAGYGAHTVLHDVSAELPPARATALVGSNGAGKSTLLAVLAGVLAPTAGDVAGLGPRRPAFVVQRSAVPDNLPITVRETVAMGRWQERGPWRRLTARDRALVEKCLARMDVLDLAERQLGSLSGGQRQRVLVAQGLAQRPDVLLLDEPTAGLDGAARDQLSRVMEDTVREGVTVVCATHDLDVALRADHCLLLGDGRVRAEGRPADVLVPDALRSAWGVPTVPVPDQPVGE